MPRGSDSEVKIRLPKAVLAVFTDAADRRFLKVDQYIRQVLIDIYLKTDSTGVEARSDEVDPDNGDVAPTNVVYFLQASKDGPVKIGATSDFSARYATLQSVNAKPLDVLGLLYCATRREAFEFEQTVKQRFKALKTHGEWFKPTKELLTYIKDQTVQAAARSVGTGQFGTKSGFKGVYAYGKRWAAVVFDNGKRRRLGVCDTPEEAARLYDQYLTAQAGDPRAAVNFPGDLDALRDASTPFVEKLAAGQVNDIEWKAWQEATKNHPVPPTGPMPVIPTSTSKLPDTMPLIDRPARSLVRKPPPAPTPFVSPPAPADDDDH